jgi:hypothetical protein
MLTNLKKSLSENLSENLLLAIVAKDISSAIKAY